MTKQTDYGIVLLTQMATRPGRLLTANELAAETSIPLPTVSKVLKLLAREGLLGSQRGVKGGYLLARDPREISVAEVISVLDGPIAFAECIDETPGLCHQEDSCHLRSHWQHVNRVIQQALEGISLAQLCRPAVPALVQLGNGVERHAQYQREEAR